MGETRLNCWEVLECGREIGGTASAELGVCPAALEAKLDGANEGRNAGRACWVVAGTYCHGDVQGEFAQKAAGCRGCDFYHQVQAEEGPAYTYTSSLLVRLRDL